MAATPPEQHDWNAIRTAVVGGLSTRAAAKKFRIPYSTLKKRAARKGCPSPAETLYRADISFAPT